MAPPAKERVKPTSNAAYVKYCTFIRTGKDPKKDKKGKSAAVKKKGEETRTFICHVYAQPGRWFFILTVPLSSLVGKVQTPINSYEAWKAQRNEQEIAASRSFDYLTNAVGLVDRSMTAGKYQMYDRLYPRNPRKYKNPKSTYGLNTRT